ncbi:hypothetical protein IT411_03360, partial [Candidatus Peregrinibacteria bacterium]|nr:hypothetical protein [Candidatus Peregrinibacteria bacterium]
MPKPSSKGAHLKTHQTLSAAEENLERALHEVEDENREFYAEELERAKTVSTLQTCIGTKVSNVLDTKYQGAMDAVIEERVDSELYKAIAGNEIYDTSNGEDSKNYRHSINGRLITPKKSGIKKMAKKILASFGGKDEVILEKEERLGPSKKLADRKLFVAERMRDFLEELSLHEPLQYADLINLMGLTPGALVDDVIDQFTRISYSKLREIRKWSITNAVQIHENIAFLDLLMLHDQNQRQAAKFGIMKVFDHTDLRKFWDDMLANTIPQVQDLMKKFHEMLIPGSLFKLEGNPEGTALISQVRKQFESEKNKHGGDEALASLKMFDDLEMILQHDVPMDGAVAPATPAKIKLTPFVLLQRLLRVEYCENRGINPVVYNEEANHYASIKAAARVEDAKNVDMFRSANAQAAEFVLKGKFAQTTDKLAG